MQASILDRDALRTTSELAEIRAALASRLPMWIDLQHRDEDADALLADLAIHPLTVEDIWAERAAPKLEDYDNYLYLIVHGVRGEHDGRFDLVELDILIGPTWVVTHGPDELVRDTREDLARTPRLLAK